MHKADVPFLMSWLQFYFVSGYGIEDDRIGFNVTNYPESGTNVHEFRDCLKQSLDDLYSVFNDKNVNIQSG